MIQLMPPNEYPNKDEVVFATNEKGFIGIVYWDGDRWRSAETGDPVKIGHWIKIVGN